MLTACGADNAVADKAQVGKPGGIAVLVVAWTQHLQITLAIYGCFHRNIMRNVAGKTSAIESADARQLHDSITLATFLNDCKLLLIHLPRLTADS
jgi:hypothetical protein